MSESLMLAPSVALSPIGDSSAIYALAAMPEEQFAAHLRMLKVARERTQMIFKSLMVVGTHYDTVPGAKRPSLWLPGAEVLAQSFRLVPEYTREIVYGDGVTAPAVVVTTECRLHFGDLDGPVVGTGGGACSSWEKKYRYRVADRSCPSCGVVGTVKKSKADKNGGWYCWSKIGGCGATFKEGDAAVEDQISGQEENPDPHEQIQTFVQMSRKRAYIEGVRTTTAASDLFTLPYPEESAATGRKVETPKARQQAPPAAAVNGGQKDEKRAPSPAQSDDRMTHFWGVVEDTGAPKMEVMAACQERFKCNPPAATEDQLTQLLAFVKTGSWPAV